MSADDGLDGFDWVRGVQNWVLTCVFVYVIVYYDTYRQNPRRLDGWDYETGYWPGRRVDS